MFKSSGLVSRRSSGTAATLVLSVAVLGSCGIMGLGDEEMGFIVFHGAVAEVAVPGVVNAGTDFTVELQTFGGGCDSKGNTRVVIDGSVAVVTPFDDHGSGACVDMRVFFDHTTSVRLDAPGPATVVIHGRIEPGGRDTTWTYPVQVQ